MPEETGCRLPNRGDAGAGTHKEHSGNFIPHDGEQRRSGRRSMTSGNQRGDSPAVERVDRPSGRIWTWKGYTGMENKQDRKTTSGRGCDAKDNCCDQSQTAKR